MSRRFLSFEGMLVRVDSDCEQVIAFIDFDFSAFLADLTPDSKSTVTVSVFSHVAPPGTVPPLDESFRTSSFVWYQDGSKRFIDYAGGVLSIFQRDTEDLALYGENIELLYEKVYLSILSRVGEYWDRRGLHRVHGLALEHKGNAALILMPSGGGKSTLAMSLIQREGSGDKVRVMADDAPLVDRAGRLHAFPFRIGASDTQSIDGIAPSSVRAARTATGRTKYLVNIASVAHRISRASAPTRFVIRAKWTTSSDPRVDRVSRLSIFWALFRDCVVGIGLPQLAELIITFDLAGVTRIARIGVSRLRTTLQLAMTAEPIGLFLCADREKNRSAVVSFLASD